MLLSTDPAGFRFLRVRLEHVLIMSDVKPPVLVDLTWDGGLTFTASQPQHRWVLDGRNEAGPTPVAALAAALAGCMATDVVDILIKGRHVVTGLGAKLVGYRADEDPRRFVRMDVTFRIETAATTAQVGRAITLSREKYCSVWQSLRQDIELTIGYEIIHTD
jgi:putative redox protein